MWRSAPGSYTKNRTLPFDGAHAIAGIIEVYGLLRPEAETQTVGTLEGLHKRFKYGLPSQSAVLLYEMGFSDRVIASALGTAVGLVGSKADIKAALRVRRDELSTLLAQYPAYFVGLFERVAR